MASLDEAFAKVMADLASEKAARLRAEAAAASAKAARERAEADLAARLSAVSVVQPPPQPPPPPPQPRTVLQAYAAVPMVTVDSPTAPNAPSVFAATARLSLSEGPLSPALAPLSAASSLTAWDTCSVDELLREASGVGPAMLHLPPWIENKSGGKMMTASTLFFSGKLPATIPTVLGKVMPWNCRPELLTAVREPFHPAFNGEVKSAMSAGDKGGRLRMLDELATYCMLGMLASFFRGVPAGAQRFFSEPPYAFGLAAFPHVGYLLAVEWVGTLHVTVVSEPFFLGSPGHAAAIARLPDCDMSTGYVELAVDRLLVGASPPELGTRPRVLWRTEPPPQAAGPPAPDGRG